MQNSADPPEIPPQPPAKPEPGDCCGGGCVNCVYDVYEKTLERYRSQLAQWQARQALPPTADNE